MGFKWLRVQCLVYGLALLALHAHPLRLCGARIPEVLDNLCTSGFNTKLKRSALADQPRDRADLGVQLDTDSQLMRILLGDGSYQLLTRRRRLGIHDECCVRSCRYEELRSYCQQ